MRCELRNDSVRRRILSYQVVRGSNPFGRALESECYVRSAASKRPISVTERCRVVQALVDKTGDRERTGMMGQHSGKQDRLFYFFNLDEHVPADHLLRTINTISIAAVDGGTRTRPPHFDGRSETVSRESRWVFFNEIDPLLTSSLTTAPRDATLLPADHRQQNANKICCDGHGARGLA